MTLRLPTADGADISELETTRTLTHRPIRRNLTRVARPGTSASDAEEGAAARQSG
jgi:hypothetical protein